MILIEVIDRVILSTWSGEYRDKTVQVLSCVHTKSKYSVIYDTIKKLKCNESIRLSGMNRWILRPVASAIQEYIKRHDEIQFIVSIDKNYIYIKRE